MCVSEMEGLFIQLLLVILFGLMFVGAIIDQVDDSELVHLLTSENNVIVLFTKNSCHECDNFETILENVENELKDNIGAAVVKAHNSHMIGLYNPSKEPALIYFRRGMPLLYYGSPNEQEIVQVFSENREPAVKELSDINFEHLTQAATGATTGDWFLFFYSTDCVFCLRLHAIWEAVGARLKHRMNVARIDVLEAGVSTAKRFGTVTPPEFIFLRQGKFYRYKKSDYTTGSLIEFVEKDFKKQTNPETISPKNNTINKILNGYIDSLNNNLKVWMMSSIGILLTITLGCIIKYVSFKRTAVQQTKKAK